MDLGRMFFLAHPGMLRGEFVEGGINKFAIRFGVFELFELLHALVILDAFHFHLGHLAVLHLIELFAEDDVRIFEDRFNEGEQHERVIRSVGIHQRNRVQQIQGQHLIHGKIFLQIDVHSQGTLPSSVLGMNSTILRSISERNNCHARWMCAFFAFGVSWLS